MLRVTLANILPRPNKSKYRKYNEDALAKAFSAVRDGMAIRKAARTFCVPVTTLHDRLSGKIEMKSEKSRSGPEPLLSSAEELKLVEHVKSMASFGYGYTRQEVINIATDLAVCMHKKAKDDKPLSLHWFYGFLGRWPDLKVQKPRSLEIHRAKATSEETVTNYYSHLEDILNECDLKESPERIYNIDEKGLMEHHSPPHIVGPSGDAIAVTLPKSSTTTVIGCVNAIGNAIPPYFIFKGKRMRDELLHGSVPGTEGSVSELGWSNGEIFKKYLAEHFLKFISPPTEEKPVLILYDGHKSHVSVSLCEWARQMHIILFVLPAHTSHILQPLDVGCFGPFEKIYCNLRHKYMRDHATSGVDRHAVCRLGGQAYITALTASNIQSSFRKCGIYPFNKDVISPSTYIPSTIFKTNSSSSTAVGLPAINPEPASIAPTVDLQPKQAPAPSITTPTIPSPTETFDISTESPLTSFFSKINSSVFKETLPKKKRKFMSSIVGGKAITTDAILEKMREHEKTHQPKQKKKIPCPPAVPSVSATNRPDANNNAKPNGRLTNRPTVIPTNVDHDESSMSDSEVDDEVCCQCKKWQPAAVKDCVSLVLVSWAQCTHPNCEHWVHLKFCTPVRCVRSNAEFLCPCHDE